VRFESDGVHLAGRLVMPPGTGPVPLVVLVHGSEDSSAREFYALQRQLPAEGIATFVYDKRGTGGSAGTYTHDYHALAGDAVAALGTARRLAGARVRRAGFHGSSQGGWVAPLAATQTEVDFLIVAYGLAVSPFDEDREAVALDMARHGFGADETRKALEVAAAAHAVITSGFQAGYAQLHAQRDRYAREPWFRYLRGNVTHLLLSIPEDELRAQGPKLLAGILPDYDPMPVLGKLAIPQLWIFGADDIDAPPGETLRRLRALRREGKPLSLVIYPRAEHGLYEYELTAGERLSTRQPSTYLPLMSEFALRGRIGRRYADAVVYP
jgi:pimeloyl-ACP methyl ester carboxylesterase